MNVSALGHGSIQYVTIEIAASESDLSWLVSDFLFTDADSMEMSRSSAVKSLVVDDQRPTKSHVQTGRESAKKARGCAIIGFGIIAHGFGQFCAIIRGSIRMFASPWGAALSDSKREPRKNAQ
jgi:hypothetical protein